MGRGKRKGDQMQRGKWEWKGEQEQTGEQRGGCVEFSPLYDSSR